MKGSKLLTAIFGLAIAAVSAAPAGAADSVADFYKGKQVRVIVGSDAGGGYDVYARLMARHLGRFIPGNPTFVVQNQPGAGSISAANAVYVTLPQDGTVIGGLQRGTPFEQLLGHQGPQFEATKFNWLGSLNNEVGVVAVMATAKAKKFEDLKTTDTIFGSSGPNDTEIYPSLLINMMGAKIKLIGGYSAATQISLAMERGEVEGESQSWSSLNSQHPEWYKEKKVNILAQISLNKHPDLPNVPLIMDFVNSKFLLPSFKQEDAETIWRMMLVQKSMGRPFTLGPGVPKERVDAMRKAFDEMCKDKEFLAEAEKSKTEIVAASGVDIQDMLTKVAAAPRSVLEQVSDLSKPPKK
jgi:tripartite-type tricarboxylate transporter receptor subunit TctC